MGPSFTGLGSVWRQVCRDSLTTVHLIEGCSIIDAGVGLALRLQSLRSQLGYKYSLMRVREIWQPDAVTIADTSPGI